MANGSGDGESTPDDEDDESLERLRARAEAGEVNAAGLYGELLARAGDLEGALRVWADAYGRVSHTTRRLAELLAEDGDLRGAVQAWECSDVVWQNPIGLHAKRVAEMTEDERMEWWDDPEDWAYTEWQQLTRMLAERGDEAAAAEVRRWTHRADPPAAG